MKILVGTPASGGQITVQYFLSFVDTIQGSVEMRQQLAKHIVENTPNFNNRDPQHIQGLNQSVNQGAFNISVYTMSNESLISRGRNHIASVCLYGGHDKLFFIDADTGWNWEQFKAIAESPLPIIGGVVPLKTYPNYPNNFKTSLNFMPFKEDNKYFQGGGMIKDLEGTRAMAKASGSPIVKVPFTGTAFLCIHRSVLMKMAETAEHYVYPDPLTNQPCSHWSFFDGGAIKETYKSEDWQFCHRARELGFDIHINTDIVLSHTGVHTFRAG